MLQHKHLFNFLRLLNRGTAVKPAKEGAQVRLFRFGPSALHPPESLLSEQTGISNGAGNRFLSSDFENHLCQNAKQDLREANLPLSVSQTPATK